MHDLMISAWADALGISEETLESRLDDGERIFEIAEVLGFKQDEFNAMAQEVHDTVKEAAIDEGLLTEEQAERMPGFGVPGAFGLRQQFGDGNGPLHDYIVSALAEALGMTPDEFEAARDEGKTLVEIAEDQGIDIDLRDLMRNVHEDAYDQAVEDGAIDEDDCPAGSWGMGRGMGQHRSPGSVFGMQWPDSDSE
jgi:hypothetical protein